MICNPAVVKSGGGGGGETGAVMREITIHDAAYYLSRASELTGCLVVRVLDSSGADTFFSKTFLFPDDSIGEIAEEYTVSGEWISIETISNKYEVGSFSVLLSVMFEIYVVDMDGQKLLSIALPISDGTPQIAGLWIDDDLVTVRFYAVGLD